MLNNYIISLTDAHKRRSHIQKSFEEKNIPFNFFDAVSPSPLMDSLIDDILPNLRNAQLTNGEKACLMSHVSLWQKCIDENLPYISIFEDDVVIGLDSQLLLNSTQWLDQITQFENSFIVRLETFCNPVKIKKTQLSSIGKYQLSVLRSAHYGTAAYIISQPAAKKLINHIRSLTSDSFDPVDIIIFDRILFKRDFIVLQVSPAPCIQELQLLKEKSNLHSQLESERTKTSHQNRKKIKKSIRQKISKEINRSYKKIDNKIRKIRNRNLPFQKIDFDQ